MLLVSRLSSSRKVKECFSRTASEDGGRPYQLEIRTKLSSLDNVIKEDAHSMCVCVCVCSAFVNKPLMLCKHEIQTNAIWYSVCGYNEWNCPLERRALSPLERPVTSPNPRHYRWLWTQWQLNLVGVSYLEIMTERTWLLLFFVHVMVLSWFCIFCVIVFVLQQCIPLSADTCL